MKKFRFSLQRMLDYKQTMLAREKDVLHSMHAERVVQEQRKERNETELLALDRHLKSSAASGVTALQAQMMTYTIDNTRTLIHQQEADLVILTKRIEEQTQVVVAFSKEVSGLERLEEKQREEYNYAAQKEDAETISEIVSAQYIRAQSNA